jgi:hypothetical protein
MSKSQGTDPLDHVNRTGAWQRIPVTARTRWNG